MSGLVGTVTRQIKQNNKQQKEKPMNTTTAV